MSAAVPPQPGSTSRLAAVVTAIARRPSLWIALFALLVAAVIGLLRARGPLVDVAAVTRTDIEQHLDAEEALAETIDPQHRLRSA